MKPLDIKIYRSLRNKKVKLVIKTDLILYLFVPFYYDNQEIQGLLAKHQEWISKHVEKISQQHQNYQQILQDHPKQVLAFGEWKNIALYPNIHTIKKRLLEYLFKRVDFLAKEMRVTYQSIQVRPNKRVLGSCSFNNNLSFSYLLFFASLDLIDYVIIHELAHINHKNHGKMFWELVEKFCKNYQWKRKEIKNNMGLYTFLYQTWYS